MDGIRGASSDSGRRAPGWPGVAVLLLAVGLSVAALAPLSAESGAPLTNEDVVRRFVTGASEKELIAWIQDSEVAFDLTEEMRFELKLAGLPPAVLEAMIRRQESQAAASATATEAPEPEPEPDSPTGDPLLIVKLDGTAGDAATDGAPAGGPSIRVLELLPPEVVEQLGIRDPDARVTDVAIFLGCRTADHVPDHWRSQTPLGRDFLGTPRHRMLQFVGGASREPAGEQARRLVAEGAPLPDVLVLPLPEALSTPLEPEVAHDLTIGIALEVAGRWYLAVRDDRDGIVLDEGAGSAALGAHLAAGADPLTLSLVARFE